MNHVITVHMIGLFELWQIVENMLILGMVELHITKESLALLVTDIVYRYVWLLKFILNKALLLIVFFCCTDSAQHLVYAITGC